MAGIIRISALLLLVVAATADANGVTSGSTALTPLLPARGAYYDSSKPGTGVWVDVGLEGFVFLSYDGYDELGAPVWHMIQGLWTPTSEPERIASGKIGKLTQPLLDAAGGQCITCDYAGPPHVSVDALAASVTWTTPRHLDLAIGDQQWHMDAATYSVAEDQLMAGDWALAVSWDIFDCTAAVCPSDVGPIPVRTQIVRLSQGEPFDSPPVPIEAVLADGADPSIALPPSGSLFYYVSPQSTPTDGSRPSFGAVFDDLAAGVQFAPVDSFNAFPSPVFWYDPASRRGGLDIVTFAGGVDTGQFVFGPNDIHFDVYVDEDRIVGHGVPQGANLLHASYWQTSSVVLNLVMTRLPNDGAGFVEHCILNCM
ncbi:MAG TPA: hypothetical protein VFB32_00090 [Rudaea sp.]|nr:hypothetical protein [Rudaea sp.]